MNISGAGSYSNIYSAGSSIDKSSERIASGQRINNAADDAAGLSISNRFSSQIKGFNQSIQNANDGISMLQTKDAAIQGINDGLDRVRELSLQAANGTLNDSDRALINKEAQQLVEGIQQSIENSSFNQQPLLKGEQSVDLQVGPGAEDQITVASNDFAKKLEDVGFGDLDLSSASGASDALAVVDGLKEEISSESATIGASLNRLESSINNLSSSALSAEKSRSTISDADYAKEISDKSNEQVKLDAAIAMKALANQNKGSVLRLLET
jgi:flagellin